MGFPREFTIAKEERLLLSVQETKTSGLLLDDIRVTKDQIQAMLSASGASSSRSNCGQLSSGLSLQPTKSRAESLTSIWKPATHFGDCQALSYSIESGDTPLIISRL